MIISIINAIHTWRDGKTQPWFHSIQTPLWNTALENATTENTGRGKQMCLIRWVTQPPRVKNPHNHLYPTDHGLQQRLVAGRCPTCVLGHGHQWLLPTRVSGGHPPPLLKGLHYFWAEIKTTRSGFQFRRNIYFFFNHTSTSAKFIPDNPVPKILQGLYFSNFIIPDCFLSLLSFHWGYYSFSQDAYNG